MKEVKFLAWEKNLNEIIPVHNIDFERKIINTESAWRRFDEVELLEYTGLKDRNGIEIYEGHILKGCFNDENRLTAVQWSEEWACWVVSYKGYGLSTFKYVEVVGHIYEKPELIKQ